MKAHQVRCARHGAPFGKPLGCGARWNGNLDCRHCGSVNNYVKLSDAFVICLGCVATWLGVFAGGPALFRKAQ